jgi:hypothetical protein
MWTFSSNRGECLRLPDSVLLATGLAIALGAAGALSGVLAAVGETHVPLVTASFGSRLRGPRSERTASGSEPEAVAMPARSVGR